MKKLLLKLIKYLVNKWLDMKINATTAPTPPYCNTCFRYHYGICDSTKLPTDTKEPQLKNRWKKPFEKHGTN
jgi:hypothetical protein